MLGPIIFILVVLVLSYLFGEFFRHFGIPKVFGYVLSGLFLTLPALKMAFFTETNLEILKFLADIGLILLFFFVGLGIDFRKMRSFWTTSIYAGFFNTLFPFLAVFLISLTFQLPVEVALIVGLAAAMSAQIISIDILEELNLLRTKLGELILTIGISSDVIQLFFLVFLVSLLNIPISTLSFFQVLLNIVLFVVVSVIFYFVIAPFALRFFEEEKNEVSLFTGIFILSLFMALLSEALGLSVFVGALVAGVIIRHLLTREKKAHKIWEEHFIAKTVHVISFGFFIPLFFVWVGINALLPKTLDNLSFTLTITILAIAGIIFGTLLGVYLVRKSFREGLVAGIAQAGKGDMDLIIAVIALSSSLISPQIYSSIIFMSLFSILLAPLLFRSVIHYYFKK